MEISEIILQQMKIKNIGAKELKEMSGVSYHKIVSLIDGDKTIKLCDLERLVLSLGIIISYKTKESTK